MTDKKLMKILVEKENYKIQVEKADRLIVKTPIGKEITYYFDEKENLIKII